MMVRESYSDENKNKFFVRFVYDVTCFIIINIMLLNIIFGIIIDTFAVLRDEKNTIEYDKKNVCFVCSIHRQAVSLRSLKSPFLSFLACFKLSLCRTFS